jgi:hypothetical protein
MNMLRLLLDYGNGCRVEEFTSRALGVQGEAHEDAKAFWTDLLNIRQYPI